MRELSIITPWRDPEGSELEARQRAANKMFTSYIRALVSPYPCTIMGTGGDEFRPGKARNMGADAEPAETLVFWDADVVPDFMAWVEAVRAVTANEADLCSPCSSFYYSTASAMSLGWLLSNNAMPWQNPLPALCKDFKLHVPEVTHCPGILVISWDAFEALNGWDPEYIGWGPEDRDIWLRAQKLGLRCGRIKAPMAHLNHGYSQRINLHKEANDARFAEVSEMTADQIEEHQKGWAR